jgi:hypothetical protein
MERRNRVRFVVVSFAACGGGDPALGPASRKKPPLRLAIPFLRLIFLSVKGN